MELPAELRKMLHHLQAECGNSSTGFDFPSRNADREQRQRKTERGWVGNGLTFLLHEFNFDWEEIVLLLPCAEKCLREMEFTCGARQCLSTQKSAGAYSRQRIMPDLNFVVGIVMAVVAMCSIIGNSLVFIVICWNQSLKKPLNLFLFNLAIADIGLSSTCIPYAIGQLAFTSSVSTFLL